MERPDADAKLIELLVSDLGIAHEAITPEARLQEDLGLDSLGMVELLLAMEEAFGVSIPDEEAERIATVTGAVEAVLRLGGRHGRG
jgi:acyl carrier protein